MTFPSQDFQRLPDPDAKRRPSLRMKFGLKSPLPLPVLVGIGIAVLVIVLIALFPGAPKLATPHSGVGTARPTAAADAVPAGPAEPIKKPSPVVPKRGRRDR